MTTPPQSKTQPQPQPQPPQQSKSLQSRLLLWTLLALLTVAVLTGSYGVYQSYQNLATLQQNNLKNIAKLFASAPRPPPLPHLTSRVPTPINLPTAQGRGEGRRGEGRKGTNGGSHTAEQTQTQRTANDSNPAASGGGVHLDATSSSSSLSLRQYDSQRYGEMRVHVIPLPINQLPAAQQQRIRNRHLLDVPIGFGEQNIGGENWHSYRLEQPHQIIIVRQKTTLQQQMARTAAWQAFVPAVLSLLILLILLPAVLWRVFRPVRQLSVSVAQRDERDMTALDVNDIPKELLPLITAINRLLAKVDEHLQQQQRFIADAAHELRSPLTAISLQLQRLERLNQQQRQRYEQQARKDTTNSVKSSNTALAASVQHQQQMQQGLHKLSLRVKHNQHLVEQLLSMARVDTQHNQHSCTDLQQVVEQAIQLLLPIADSKQQQLSVYGLPDSAQVGAVLPRVMMDSTALLLVIKNLLQNAILYTPKHGHVAIIVTDTKQLSAQQSSDDTDDIAGITVKKRAGKDHSKHVAKDTASKADDRNLRFVPILINGQDSRVTQTPHSLPTLAEVYAGQHTQLVLQICDTGVGMAAADYPRAFMPFVRLSTPVSSNPQDRTSRLQSSDIQSSDLQSSDCIQQVAADTASTDTSSEHKGTGLGLAIVYEICRKAGVAIYVHASCHNPSRINTCIGTPAVYPPLAKNPDMSSGMVHQGMTVTLVFAQSI